MALAVLSIFRDESANLPRFLAELEKLEQSRIVGKIYCSFYENDSCDDSVIIVDRWLASHPGSLISQQRGTSRIRGRVRERTQLLAEARNIALEPLLTRAESFLWLLTVDIDLYFSASHIINLISILMASPEISMVTASSMQNVPDVFGEYACSYYDSWALLDSMGRGGISFAANPMRTRRDRFRWMSGLPIAVRASFGGMALTRFDNVKQLRLRWNGDMGCEHWAFCEGARRGGAVLACPTVMPRVIHSPPIPSWNQAYAARVNSFLVD